MDYPYESFQEAVDAATNSTERHEAFHGLLCYHVQATSADGVVTHTWSNTSFTMILQSNPTQDRWKFTWTWTDVAKR